MLPRLDDKTIPYHAKLRAMQEMISTSRRFNYLIRAEDRKTLEDHYTEYGSAYVIFGQNNTDETMINLIGKHARLGKIMRDLEKKYLGSPDV
jgi:hypothetical protein